MTIRVLVEHKFDNEDEASDFGDSQVEQGLQCFWQAAE